MSNKEYHREYSKKHYLLNKTKYLAKAKHHKKGLRRQRETLFNELKDIPCLDCGKRYPPCVMDFDHVRGVKKFNVGRAKYSSLKALKEEIEKCEIVCANCHRLRTFSRRGGKVDAIALEAISNMSTGSNPVGGTG